MALYDVLIRPIQTHLRDRTALLIVPTACCMQMPFTALIRLEDIIDIWSRTMRSRRRQV